MDLFNSFEHKPNIFLKTAIRPLGLLAFKHEIVVCRAGNENLMLKAINSAETCCMHDKSFRSFNFFKTTDRFYKHTLYQAAIVEVISLWNKTCCICQLKAKVKSICFFLCF